MAEVILKDNGKEKFQKMPHTLSKIIKTKQHKGTLSDLGNPNIRVNLKAGKTKWCILKVKKVCTDALYNGDMNRELLSAERK